MKTGPFILCHVWLVITCIITALAFSLTHMQTMCIYLIVANLIMAIDFAGKH